VAVIEIRPLEGVRGVWCVTSKQLGIAAEFHRKHDAIPHARAVGRVRLAAGQQTRIRVYDEDGLPQLAVKYPRRTRWERAA
jgi:hypothetical protein